MVIILTYTKSVRVRTAGTAQECRPRSDWPNVAWAYAWKHGKGKEDVRSLVRTPVNASRYV
jgi:hypothetical protein